MIFVKTGSIDLSVENILIPITEGTYSSEVASTVLGTEISEFLAGAVKLDEAVLLGEKPKKFTVLTSRGMKNVIVFQFVKEKTKRKMYLQLAKAVKASLNGGNLAVVLSFAEEALKETGMIEKFMELPIVANYKFDYYLKKKAAPMVDATFYLTTEDLDVSDFAKEANFVANATIMSKDLINHPSCYMTPERLAEAAKAVGEEVGIEVEVLNKEAIETLEMASFLAVSKGAKQEPKLIIMRYQGGEESDKKIALIGKGIMFDSGGYSLKPKMSMITMHHDMGGAGAVIGAMKAIAQSKLKKNVIAIIPACENKIGEDAYVPGDVIGSMKGTTIEVVSTDAEGRLVLCDALTYAIRNENVDALVDIATLTGSAAQAVGDKTAPVFANDETMYQWIATASQESCEKVWRFDLDEEVAESLKSSYADMRNSAGGAVPGGTIQGALFLQEFVENYPWIHLDIAPVSWLKTEMPYGAKGATAFGVNLLYNFIKQVEN